MINRVLRAGVLVGAVMGAMTLSSTQAADIKKGVPEDSYIVIYERSNPEREYQKKYYEEVWNTVEETKIIDKFLGIIQAQVGENELAQAKAIIDEMKSAAEPIDWEVLGTAEESIYSQSFEFAPFPTSQHLALVQTTAEGASGMVSGMENLFKMAEKYSDGALAVEKTTTDGVTMVTLRLPGDMPYQPCVAIFEDVLVIASSDLLAQKSIDMMSDGTGKSKFDDERLKDALSKLPEAEDMIVFYDAKTQFEQFQEFPNFIRQISGGAAEGEKAATVVEDLLDQLSVMDYEVTVGYTEGHQNRTETLGRVLEGTEDRMLAKVMNSGKPFENWGQWVPANATAYSMSTGVNLHEIYAWAIPYVREQFPEVQGPLDQFEAMQEQVGIHLDKDILQSFSGESVSVNFPATVPSPFGGGGESVMFLRCQKPERIEELMNRGIAMLQENPSLKSQQLKFTESSQLEGFKEMSAMALNMVGMKPVVGFHDGWMVVGTSAQAVKSVLDTRAGDAESVTSTDGFKRFGVEIEGPIRSISYTDLAANTRNMAMVMGQMGTMLPGLMAMAGGGQTQMEEMKPVLDMLGLLPDLGRIIAKFDFLEAELSVVQDGKEPGTYTKKSVVLVRPPSN